MSADLSVTANTRKLSRDSVKILKELSENLEFYTQPNFSQGWGQNTFPNLQNVKGLFALSPTLTAICIYQTMYFCK